MCTAGNKKQTQLRRNQEYYYDGTGNRRSEDTAERNRMAGDYDRFSRYMEQGARIFYEQLDIPAGCQLLDVACGSGQVALWAARDGVKVTGVDIAPNLVQRAQARANAEGLNAHFVEGDAESLPFEDASFDVVTSLFGAMFAP